jgi:hypothetical protein
MVYVACFHSVINYGLICWGNSTNVQRVFRVQKRVIRIMSGVGMGTSCRGLFRKHNILPVACQYIFSLMFFVVANQNNFQTNLIVHDINTRNRNQFHLPSVFPPSKRVFYIWASGFLIISQKILAVLGVIGYNSKENCKSILLPTLFIHLLNFFN